MNDQQQKTANFSTKRTLSWKKLIAFLCIFTLALSSPVYVYAGTFPKSRPASADDYCVGDTYLFGHYEQDNDSRTDPKKEDLSWIIIDRDEDYLLLLSEYGIDNVPYQSSGDSTTWANCKLRTWLNGTFLNTAFTSSELKRIAEASVPATENYHYPKVDVGKPTEDKIFLLSIDEVDGSVLSKSVRKCTATEYAQGRGAWVDKEDKCCWWLRTQGCSGSTAAYVGADGSVVDKGFSNNKLIVAVRPALWVKIS